MYKHSYLIWCLVGAGALTGCGSRPTPGVVAENWATNTEQLGIQAIYPPRAQFEVGDVFVARSVGKGQKSKTADYVLGSIRVDHIDLSEELYRSAPTVTFESSDTYDDGTGIGTVQTRKVLPLKVRDRVINSLVAFPGFTFASLAESDVGVNVTSNAIGALIGLGRRSQYSVSYSVPAAETYGVSYLEARRRFNEVAPTRYTIKDRQMLKEAAQALSTSGRGSEGAQSVLVLITDVYLARAIDVSVSSEEGMSATFSALTMAMVDLSDKKKSIEAQLLKLRKEPNAGAGAGAGAEGKVQTQEDKETKPADPQKSDKPQPEVKTAAAAVSTTSQARIDELEAELEQVNSQLRDRVNKVAPDLPGVTGSVVRSSALGVTLRQAFARPVAIGYRGINYSIESLLPPPVTAQNLGELEPSNDRVVVLIKENVDPKLLPKSVRDLLEESLPQPQIRQP
ncbi:hypothetical protein [Pseudomonas sp. GM25]|uniref:hypothetical protein n=1 Tax=Pseudomonas sp. GM25 TaxID=1144327 RepID=UPI00026FDA1E|nr:hypothetical protein [Pseudomonas sp. GM25]EJM32659.1 hypothetical protein PMI24_00161 [Pseudomonas sp. GM25]